jgi:hypothetical protein
MRNGSVKAIRVDVNVSREAAVQEGGGLAVEGATGRLFD